MNEMKFDNYTVRLIEKDDLKNYYELIDRNRKRLEDFFAGTVALTKTLKDTKHHLADVVAKIKLKINYPFVVTDDTTGMIIASIQVKGVDWMVPKAELGYYIDAAYEGKGITTRATSLIIAYAFDELKLNKLYIRTHKENMPSVRIAEKNGFVLEGIIRSDYKTTSGTLVDLLYYGLLKEEFNPTDKNGEVGNM